MVLESLENRPAAVCPYYLCECDEYSHSWMAAIPECELRFCNMTNRKGCQFSLMLNGDEESISINMVPEPYASICVFAPHPHLNCNPYIPPSSIPLFPTNHQ